MNRTLLSLLSLIALLPLAAHAADPTFVPLTSIPALQNVSQADGLSNFLNQIYILCVGAAAVLAVIQLTRAGIMYALTDTGVTEKREARHLMVMSVLGLLLVLSPTIVFGIINPDILKLTINTGVLTPTTAPDPTCETAGVVGVVDREPAANETWAAAAHYANFYGQCCASPATMPSGTTCSVAQTNVGQGQFCKCTAIAAKWHLLVGNAEEGGLVVQFRTPSASNGDGVNCMLGANEGTDTYYESENACKAAYASEDQIVSLIKAGKLGAYISTSRPTCFPLSNALHGTGGGTVPTGVKIVGPAACSMPGATSAKGYAIE